MFLYITDRFWKLDKDNLKIYAKLITLKTNLAPWSKV